jgi:KDEL-tailed cysteine endopeptidase
MKVLITVSVALLALMSAGIIFQQVSTHKQVPHTIVQAYSKWLQEHGKLYSTPAEHNFRLGVFYEQTLYIEQINREYEEAIRLKGQTLSGPMFEMNGFGDLTVEEFKAKYTGGLIDPHEQLQDVQLPQVEAEPSLSSSSLGAGYNIIIRDQGGCGSCWAFAAVASLEKFYFDKQQKRIELSQQELVDCAASGCNGGAPGIAFDYASKNGLALLSNYPYKGSQGHCNKSKANNIKLTVATTTSPYSQKLAVAYSAKGYHSSVGVYSSGKFAYLSKTSDVFDASVTKDCGKWSDHVINAQSASGDTVRVFNSWGTGWGEKGFKTIRVCSETNLLGTEARIVHPYI